MAKPQTAEAIAEWAEAHNGDNALAPNAGAPHLDGEDIADVLFWNRKGLTQEQIAAKFVPPKHQSSISRCLREWGVNRTTEAKRMIAAKGPALVKKIIESDDTRTMATLMKGNVLENDTAVGVTVVVNGLALHGIGQGQAVEGQVLSPPQLEAASEGE